MSKDFNLLDEPWLPVRFAGGDVEHLGLLETFRRSSRIEAIAETAPPSLIAQYRLLLAILHRALTRAFPDGWKDRDRARWYEDGLPVDAVVDYLEHWRDRFWLFHPEHPFMQVAVLAEDEQTRDRSSPWTRIDLAAASGNNPVVFDHSLDVSPRQIDLDHATRLLVGFQQFAPGGTVQVFRYSDVSCALTGAAAVIPVGASLSETLILALHKPQPLRSGDQLEDIPAWERPPLTRAHLEGAPVLATGPNDRYTRQSRAVLLIREPEGGVRWLRFGAGYGLREDPGAPDPMACYREGSQGLRRLTFAGGRALWRDLPALLGVRRAGRSPEVVNQAASLRAEVDGLGNAGFQSFLIAGIATNPRRAASILRWRTEQIALPAVLIEDPDQAEFLRDLVEKAEALFEASGKVVAEMIREGTPDPLGPEARARARQRFEAGPFLPIYFATAERALPEVMRLLAEGDYAGATDHWDRALRRSALAAWSDAVTGLGKSARALRAEARAWPRFHDLLAQHVPAADTSTTVEEA